MGAILQDIDKTYYTTQINNGLTYKEIIKSVPERRRARFETSINMSGIQAHFGIKPWMFWLSLVSILLSFVVLSIFIILVT